MTRFVVPCSLLASLLLTAPGAAQETDTAPETNEPEASAERPGAETAETEPSETDAVEADTVETGPVETDPVETDPAEADPVESDPVESEAGMADEPPVQHAVEPAGNEAVDGTDLDAPADGDPGPLPEPLEYAEEENEPEEAGDRMVGPVLRHLLGTRFSAWAEVSITTGGPDDSQVTAFVPEFGLRYRVVDAVVADVSMGMLVADTLVYGEPVLGGMPIPFEGRGVRVEPGNPVLSGLFTHTEGDVSLEVGAGVAMPSASRAELGNDADSLTDRAASEAAYRASMSMRGWWSPWRFAPERVSIVVPARVVGTLEGVQLEAEAGAAVMIPVLGDRGVDPDVVLQLAGGASFALVDVLHLGARVRAVGGALGTTLPGAIASAEPWVRLDLAPFHTTLRGVINLNGMDGLVGRRGPGFGVFVGVGGSD